MAQLRGPCSQGRPQLAFNISRYSIVHIVTEQTVVQVVGLDGSDREALTVLERSGLYRGKGEVWGENDCLLDSILQLLISGVGSLTAAAEFQSKRSCDMSCEGIICPRVSGVNGSWQRFVLRQGTMAPFI